nr:14233_t:CDS:2 [Entrophospora candida]
MIQPHLNSAYSELIRKLPPSLENEAWKRLISRKRNPITEEDASSINPLIEAFLRHETNTISNCICNHEEEINRKVKKEVKILYRQILNHNQETFEKFMKKLDKEYEERINTNKNLRCEIEEKKLELDEAEKNLASMKERFN